LERGCPISISAFPRNTSDSTTLLPQVERLQNDFGLESVILVGDRGMISEVQLKVLRARSGVDWITALKSGSIRQLCDEQAIQLTLFDERNLFEFTHADFPGERLIACRNPELAYHRSHTRTSLLEAKTAALTKVQRMVNKGTLKGTDKIGVRTGRVINKYKMAKHIKLDIAEARFSFEIDKQSVSKEAELDGYLCDPQFFGNREAYGKRYCPGLQITKPSRTCVSLDQNNRFGSASYLPSWRKSSQNPFVYLYVGLLH